MAKTTRHVIISGRVQGVWFRGWTKQQASSLGLTGWVRNRRDGTVEAIFQGDAADIDAMVKACFASQDYIEGRRAFMEKRKPNFTGS